MRLMSRNLLFATFSDANNFLKKIRIGKVQRKPNTDFYFWESECDRLTQEHENMIEEADGSKFVWKDRDIGLTWLLQDDIPHLDIERLNAISYGGHDDWRVPSLRELKTLGSNVKNSFGCYVKEGLENRIRGIYVSCTTYLHWQDKAWWDFDEGCSTTEEYSEGKIKWGAEGEYAGFEKDTYHNFARLILVRGVETHFLSDWAISLRDWAESDKVFDFPVTQKTIEELENLVLYHSSSLPAAISRLPKLKHLKCYTNAGIEDALFSIPGLETLELLRPYHTKPHIEEIPASVQSLRHLVSLNATQLGLKKVHEAIGSLQQLQSLNLSVNRIESIPNSIGNLCELRFLHLSVNQITAVPNSIGQLNKLEEFSIGGHFDHLPESIGNLSELKKIIIRSDKLTEIPTSFCNLSKLEILICEAPLRRLFNPIDKLKILKSLLIENSLLDFIPNDVFAMSWLHTLSITGAPIKRIPDEISGISNLERLDLSGTQITELPRSMLLLKNLRFLNVSSTQIGSLPEWLSDMKSLSHIAGKGVKFPEVLRKKRAYAPS
jgi:Leucine-rich repeat (LRR) protein